MREDGAGVAFHVITEHDAGTGCAAQYFFKRALAVVDRISPDMHPINFDQVEGIQESRLAPPQVIEARNAAIIGRANLSVYKAASAMELVDGRMLVGETIGPIGTM